MGKTIIYPTERDDRPMVWVMISSTDDITSVRAFTSEPTAELIKQQRALMTHDGEEEVEIDLLPVSLDVFDEEESH